ncbi:MAG: response regulator [Planctomycetota bacterium]|nr:response regulator [Planctomycetota bacterium]
MSVPRKRVLVVDDEKEILEIVQYNLEKNGYDTLCVGSGEQALSAAKKWSPDIILLDLMLPGIDGLDVCRKLKGDEETRHIPIVMLTAKGEDADVVSGLELGADDYVVKPFSPRVLAARLRAVLRRREEPEAEDDAPLKFEGLEIHPGRREVKAGKKMVDLTFTEFGILHLLARRPGWVFTRYQIVDAVRGKDAAVTDRTIDVHIVSLRRKLGAAGDMIRTVRGVGYKFVPSEEE